MPPTSGWGSSCNRNLRRPSSGGSRRGMTDGLTNPWFSCGCPSSCWTWPTARRLCSLSPSHWRLPSSCPSLSPARRSPEHNSKRWIIYLAKVHSIIFIIIIIIIIIISRLLKRLTNATIIQLKKKLRCVREIRMDGKIVLVRNSVSSCLCRLLEWYSHC